MESYNDVALSSIVPKATGLILIVLACILACHCAWAKGNTDVNQSKPVIIKADFGKWIDYPLVKTKFGVYNSGFVPQYMHAYERDAKLFDEVHPDSLRIDGCLGAPKYIIFSMPPMISGKLPNVKYNFRQMDKLLDLLDAHNITPYWSYGYVPECLLKPGQSFRSVPSDMNGWGKIIAAVARHLREAGHSEAYQEIYNEPDNRDFLQGTLQDYLAMYDAGSKAIREADPEARVGGPALAFSDSWVDPFLNYVVNNHLPLDFFSFHYYPGVPYKATDVRGVVKAMRSELDKHRELSTTEMHLNEYNSFPINYPGNGPQQKHKLAAALLNDLAYFISEPSLTKVNWAQFMDTAGGNWSGLVSIDGHRKAAFNAYKIYSMMPVDRRYVSIDGPNGMGVMASSDEHKFGLLMWNLAGSMQSINLALSNIPFAKGNLRIYRIDAEHASWGDNPAAEALVPVETRKNIDMRNIAWSGDVPDGGVVYIEAEDGTGISELTPHKLAKSCRVINYYPNRNARAYADFDRNTWIARLGMAGDDRANAQVGVIADGLPSKLAISVSADGELTKIDAISLLGIRLDYQVGGRHTKSVLFHGPYNNGTDLYNSKRYSSVPWGTKRQADEVVTLSNCSKFNIAPSEYAPEGWSGRVILTFILQNAGPSARVKVIVR